MEPKETGFASPILDFFKPNKKKGIAGISFEGNFSCFYSGKRKDAYIAYGFNGSLLLPGNAVKSVFLNDLGGVSVGFSTTVIYKKNALQNVLLQVVPYDEPIGFGYDVVARVKNVDEEVVWESANVPKRKRLLKEC